MDLLLRRVLLYLSDRQWMRALIMRYPASRTFAWRFVAGESGGSALRAVRQLQAKNIPSTLDLLGESVIDAEAARRSAEEYLDLLDRIRISGTESHVSLKLTQMGLDVDEELCRTNLENILRKAAEVGTFVRFDMEASAYTQRTLDMYRQLHPTYDNCGVVIQSYLYRSAQDVEDLITEGARVRLCKGAYLEPAEVAYQHKADVDVNYVRLMERLLTDGNYPAIATHDPKIVAAARRFTEQHDIPNSKWEFQMLYGIRRDLQESLAAEGYNLRCYVPFGTEWYSYFMRRLAERPANLMFVLRNLLRERGRPNPLSTTSETV